MFPEIRFAFFSEKKIDWGGDEIWKLVDRIENECDGIFD